MYSTKNLQKVKGRMLNYGSGIFSNKHKVFISANPRLYLPENPTLISKQKRKA